MAEEAWVYRIHAGRSQGLDGIEVRCARYDLDRRVRQVLTPHPDLAGLGRDVPMDWIEVDEGTWTAPTLIIPGIAIHALGGIQANLEQTETLVDFLRDLRRDLEEIRDLASSQDGSL